jgi:diguanylate cyclase (GGDEF)-like protein
MSIIYQVGKTDYLSQTKTREFVEESANKLIKEKIPFSLVFFDLNNFKLINDIYSHLAGDKVLAAFGTFLVNSIRTEDIIGRYGGDKFVILFHKTHKLEASKMIERILTRLQNTNLGSFRIGFSFRVAELSEDASTFIELIEIADKEMYQNKFHDEVKPQKDFKPSLKLAGRVLEQKLVLSKPKRLLTQRGV